MYAAYLSFAQIQEYLKFMRTKNLLRFEEETQLYRLTEQGMRFLQACEQMSEMMALDKSPQTSTIQTQAISQKAW
jgi:predicted transcriptional regulator